MTIEKNLNGKELTVGIEGRLDTMTSPQLEEEIKPAMPEAERLIFDLSKTEYISSAGLRVMLSAQKAMAKQGGSMTVRGANEAIMDIFEVTGFVDLFTIE